MSNIPEKVNPEVVKPAVNPAPISIGIQKQAVVISGFITPTSTINVAALAGLQSALLKACQNAKTNLASDQARLNADLAIAQSVTQEATALYQQAQSSFEAGIVATPENSTDFQNCLNMINLGCIVVGTNTRLESASQLQAAYANAFSDAISAYNDMVAILANPIAQCDLSAYSSSASLTTLNTIASLGSIFNGLAGLAGLASAKITPIAALTAQQVVQCITVNVTGYGFDEVLSEQCTQQLINWFKANISTGTQDLITQFEGVLGKIPGIGSVISAILSTFTGNIFNIMLAIEKLDKGNGVTIHNSALALVVPFFDLMTTANLQNEASGTSGGVSYEDVIWVTAN
jgi:hypothetical protein